MFIKCVEHAISGAEYNRHQCSACRRASHICSWRYWRLKASVYFIQFDTCWSQTTVTWMRASSMDLRRCIRFDFNYHLFSRPIVWFVDLCICGTIQWFDLSNDNRSDKLLVSRRASIFMRRSILQVFMKWTLKAQSDFVHRIGPYEISALHDVTIWERKNGVHQFCISEYIFGFSRLFQLLKYIYGLFFLR